ncbi:hypothetical protein AAZX31_02G095100 [Glycine max]
MPLSLLLYLARLVLTCDESNSPVPLIVEARIDDMIGLIKPYNSHHGKFSKSVTKQYKLRTSFYKEMQ